MIYSYSHRQRLHSSRSLSDRSNAKQQHMLPYFTLLTFCCLTISCVHINLYPFISRFPNPPKEVGRFSNWVTNCRRTTVKPSSTAIVCGKHFEEKCFDRNGLIVRLWPEAVPTISHQITKLPKAHCLLFWLHLIYKLVLAPIAQISRFPSIGTSGNRDKLLVYSSGKH